LPKTLIDGDNNLNIIFTETFRKMEFDFTKMTACDEPFYGVVTGKAAYPIVSWTALGVPLNKLGNPRLKPATS
jgi:hypothetical protein